MRAILNMQHSSPVETPSSALDESPAPGQTLVTEDIPASDTVMIPSLLRCALLCETWAASVASFQDKTGLGIAERIDQLPNNPIVWDSMRGQVRATIIHNEFLPTAEIPETEPLVWEVLGQFDKISWTRSPVFDGDIMWGTTVKRLLKRAAVHHQIIHRLTIEFWQDQISSYVRAIGELEDRAAIYQTMAPPGRPQDETEVGIGVTIAETAAAAVNPTPNQWAQARMAFFQQSVAVFAILHGQGHEQFANDLLTKLQRISQCRPEEHRVGYDCVRAYLLPQQQTLPILDPYAKERLDAWRRAVDHTDQHQEWKQVARGLLMNIRTRLLPKVNELQNLYRLSLLTAIIDDPALEHD